MSNENEESVYSASAADAFELVDEPSTLLEDGDRMKLIASNLERLTTAVDQNFNSVLETMKTSNDKVTHQVSSTKIEASSMKNEIVEMKSEIVEMKNDIKTIKTLLEKDNELKTLERALQLVHVDSFRCYFPGSSTSNAWNLSYSKDLAKNAIEKFLLGREYQIPLYSMDCTGGKGELFRAKFMQQIKRLIGHMPRSENNGGTHYTIYYK